jgi:formylglycine-generating enzyme required for sulfatase activity
MLLAMTLVGCGDSAPQALARTGRLGSLRDLVLFERAAPLGGPFFLDRFEVTRGDWREFCESEVGRVVQAPQPHFDAPGDEALPMADIELAQARAFAAWRCCRLPLAEEWWFATTANGRYAYPWGDSDDASRANTHELGIGRAVPVGTFESGRASASAPYDLVGNIAEWTESVPLAFFRADPSQLSPSWSARRQLQASPALGAWCLPGRAWSPFFVVQAAGSRAPREVLGGDFVSARSDLSRIHLPNERADTIGLRLCAQPRELMQAIASAADQLTALDRVQLERFVRRAGHSEVLRAELGAVDRTTQRFFEPYLP